MKNIKFRINEFLELELWGDKTFIYVNGKKFTHCKYILINIPINDIERYDSIDSINDIIDRSFEGRIEDLSPAMEFWAHCSNLQAWAENNYNTKLLDSILSFPLLKQLSKAGDTQAKKAFKEEIAKRLMDKNLNIIAFLIDEKYLELFTQEEINSILSSENCLLFENIFNTLKDGDISEFNQADSIFIKMGKNLFPLIEKKLKQLIETNDLEGLYTFFHYMMLDELSDEDLRLLFDPPINLLEKTVGMFNRINYEEIGIGEYGLISKKVENALKDKIRIKLLNIINTGNIKYNVLSKLNLIKYLKNEDLRYINYLK